jgi:hypothetical protein
MYICIYIKLISLKHLLSRFYGADFYSGSVAGSNSMLRVVCRMIARNTANNTECGPQVVNHSQSSFAISFRKTDWPSDYTSTQVANQMLNDPRSHSFCCDVDTSMNYCLFQQHLMYDDLPHSQEPVQRSLVCLRETFLRLRVSSVFGFCP